MAIDIVMGHRQALLPAFPGRVLVASIVVLLLVAVQHSKASRCNRPRDHAVDAVKVMVLLLMLHPLIAKET